jgi:signal peptidase I
VSSTLFAPAPPASVLDPVPHPADEVSAPQQELSRPMLRIVLGAVARIWLWFLVGCLLIATVPLVVGWKSYLIETGSMRPAISPGDVVLASPSPALEQLGGRVVVFSSPDVPGRIITHRVVEIAPDGQMRTKGDANQSADSVTITTDNVLGLGRLLVRWIGLPIKWAQEKAFLPLSLFILSLVLAGLAIRYDRDDEDSEPELPVMETTGELDPPPPPYPFTSVLIATAASTAGARTVALPRRPRISSAAVFVVLVVLYALALLVPSAMAALSTTTRSVGSTWSVPQFSFSDEVTALTPFIQYPLDETSGTNVNDISGNNRDGTYSGGMTFGVTGPLTTDTPNRAVTLPNAASCIYTPNSAKLTPAPTVYSSLAWIRTPNGYNQGGKIVGFESSRTGVSDSNNGGQYDRHVYMDGSGVIRFGVWLGYSFTLATPTAYNDGNWHMVATTMGPAGMKLYVDGVLQASSTNTASEVFSNGGWWRFGCGNLSGWTSTSGADTAWAGPNAPVTQKNYPLLGGSLDQLTIWQNRVLTDAEVAFLYFTR